MTPTPMSCSVEQDGRSFTGSWADDVDWVSRYVPVEYMSRNLQGHQYYRLHNCSKLPRVSIVVPFLL